MSTQRIGGRYEVLERLGRGGMAVVYRVRDASSGGELALKQLTAANDARSARDPRQLFEREYSTLAQLSHPSLIAAYDFGLDPNGPFYTMELLDGGDLSERAPLPWRQACALLWQVCSSLGVLHARGLVHRDITPRNVRCTREGQAKLIDFGALAEMGPSTHGVGTPAFVAPEVVQHAALDARTDLFSLGATLYYALTGHTPFAAHSFRELREAWAEAPAPPSELVPGVPAGLDALVLALLQIDPALRPRSAFEVMQRLAAIAELAQAESELVSQAYLSSPRLTGRDAEQRRFRQQLRTALQGRGAGLAFEGESGSGRSRLLDACALEAKTLGATVLRVRGADGGRPFAAAQALGQELLVVLPELARRASQAPGADGLLPSDALAPLAELSLERHALLAALNAWIAAVAREQPLVLAVDDVERIDEASLALLAGLAQTPQVLVVLAGDVPAADESATLAVLRRQCERLSLEPLTARELESLFRSVFGAVPNLEVLCEHVQHVSRGNPRDALTFARQLLDHFVLRYADGQWILPDSTALQNLPANPDAAWNARVAALPPLALRLLQLQALALWGAFSRADYAALAREPADDALAALQRQGLVRAEGDAFRIAQLAQRVLLVAQLSAAQVRQAHSELAALCAASGRPALLGVHHLLLAGERERALDRLAQLFAELSDQTDLLQHSGLRPAELEECLVSAFTAAQQLGRKPREVHELARALSGISLYTHSDGFHRYAPAWLERLIEDSGLRDYRELEALPPTERLQTALQRAAARYHATPEEQRVYRVDEAIKYLARYVVLALPVASRVRDHQLMLALPGLLEPFAGLSPMLHALRQQAIALNEATLAGRVSTARARCAAAYETLASVSGVQLRYVEGLRATIAYLVALLDLFQGRPSYVQWMELLERDPSSRAQGTSFRSAACVFQGDLEGGERFRRQAEVLSVQSGVPSVLGPHWHYARAAIVARDLIGLRRHLDLVEKLAERYPGWRGPLEEATGWFQWVRGDYAAAVAAFERCLALEDARHSSDETFPLRNWTQANTGYALALVDGGRAAEARAVAFRALELCRARGAEFIQNEVVHALALAESALGEHASAAARLDELIAGASGNVHGMLALYYEDRARVAVAARDAAAAVHFAELATRDTQRGHGHRLLPRHSRLLEEARRAGIDLKLSASDFTSAVLGVRAAAAPAALSGGVAVALSGVSPSDRASKLLELLCQSAQLGGGHLYAANDNGLRRVASRSVPSDAALDTFANGFFTQQLDDALYTALLTQLGDSEPPVGHWIGTDGTQYALLILTHPVAGKLQYRGLAAFVAPARGALPQAAHDLARALAGELASCG